MGTIITDAMLKIDNSVKMGMAVMPNGNQVMIGPKTTTSFRVYEASDRATWVVRANITVTALPAAGVKYVVNIGHDGTYIVLTYVCNDGSVRSRIITYSGWTVAAEQTAYTAVAGISIRTIDTDVSIGGAVLLGIHYAGPNGDYLGYITRIRYTTSPAWAAGNKVTLSTNIAGKAILTDISVAWYRTGSATARRFSVFVSQGGASTDLGVTHIHGSINETNGSAISVQDRGNLAVGALWYSSSVSYSVVPRKTMAVAIPGTTDTMAIGISSRVDRFASLPGVKTSPSHVAGTARIKTAGVNAAGDVVEVITATFDLNGVDTYESGGGTGISFALDESGNPTFNFVNSVGPVVLPGTAGLSYLQSSRTIHISNFTSSVPYMKMMQGGQWDGAGATRQVIAGHSHLAWTNRRHDMISQMLSGLNLANNFAQPLTAASVKPAAGQVVTSSKPVVGGSVGVPVSNNALPIEFYAKYTVANDPGFTSGVATFNGITRSHAPYNASSPQYSKFEEQWAAGEIFPGTRFFKVSVIDPYGNESISYQTTTPVTISHPSIARDVFPTYSETDPFAFAYSDPGALGYSEHPVSWVFSDAYPQDGQNGSRVVVTDAANTVWYDSGMVFNVNSNANIRVPFAARNTVLYVGVQVQDRFGTSVPLGTDPSQLGALISYFPATVDTLDPLTVDGLGNVNSRAPSFSYTLGLGFFDIAHLQVTITQGLKTIDTQTMINPPLAGTITFPSILDNNVDYTVTATVTDTSGLKTSRVLQIHTQWTPPLEPSGVTVSLANYNIENAAYVQIDWTDVNNDSDWVGWNIYRRVDQIDTNTGTVVESGSLDLIGTLSSIGSTMTYLDYTAPSGVKVTYVVRQVVNRLGAIIESINTTGISVVPMTDGYWLVDPTPEDPANSSFKLYNVIADGYTRKYESQITHIIGRGNHEDRGDDLGREGSLTAQLRDGNGTTARIKRRRIEKMKDEARSLYLRNPFGDLWPVAVGEIQVERIAGVGLQEFVDITIPYTEVYE